MLEKVKIALRITHNYLDSEILEIISTAKSELIRLGVPADLANSSNDLIEMAIRTYCLYYYSDDEKNAERYFNAFQYQADNIRKSNIEVPEEEEQEEEEG